jgi:hypothetical protein
MLPSNAIHVEGYEGVAGAHFCGSADAGFDALKLLNFLVGMDCLHTYGGILAGTIA